MFVTRAKLERRLYQPFTKRLLVGFVKFDTVYIMPKFAKSARLKFVYAHCILNQKSFLSYLTESKKTQPKIIAPKCVFNSNAALKELINIIRYILHFGK